MKYKEIQSEIKLRKKEIKKTIASKSKQFASLKKKQAQWLKGQDKRAEYTVDVELDQIMTFFRVSMANLFAYFIQKFMGGKKMSLVTFVHSVIHLPATIEENDLERIVHLSANEQDPNYKILKSAIKKINALKIKGAKGRIFKFAV